MVLMAKSKLSFNKGLTIGLTIVMLIIAYLLYVFTDNIAVSLLVVFGFLLSILDTSMGMGYGTIGTPVLLIAGISSVIAVPAILISQFVSSSLGSIAHRKLKNADVLNIKHSDGKITMVIVGMGLLGAIVGVLLGISLPKVYLNSYIGLLVVAMGVLLILAPKWKFSWRKLFPIGLISGFNKAISGGGYGPVVTSGLLISGKPIKNSVGIAVFSVAVITLFSFALYLLSGKISSYAPVIGILVGAAMGSQLGPRVTHKMVLKRNIKIIGIVVILLGLLTLITTFVKL